MTTTASETPIIDKYEPLFFPPSGVRYFVVTGGRGSGKSFGTQAASATYLDGTDRHQLLTRYTMKSAEKSIIPEFREKVDLLNLTNEIEVLRDSARGAKGGTIFFSGIKTGSGDQTANLKSLHDISFWVVDEAEELTDEAKFDTIDLSIRSKKHQNIVVLLMNPASKEHWVYKRFFENRGVKPGFNGVVDDVCYIHTTYKDNKKFLDQEYYNKLDNLQHINPEKYRHVVLGGWLDRAEGVVFTNWNYGDFVDTGYTYYGMDFGFSVDPDALVKVSIDNKRKRLYLKSLIYNTGNSTPELAQKVLHHKIKGTIIADSAEPRLIADLRAAGVDIQPVSKFDGSIRAGIKAMQEYQIVVDPESTEIGKELNNYVWSDKKAEVPVDEYNHAIDAVRYVLLSAMSYRPLEVY